MLRGIHNILTTPFTPDSALDEESLRYLTESVIEVGVDGITILGTASEAQKLSQAERRWVLSIVMEVNENRVPIVVGISQQGTDETIRSAQEAESAGAAGVMVAPPIFLQPSPALTMHYQRIAESIGIPIVLQDYPPANGVTMTPSDMANLVELVPSIKSIKLEDTPTPQRIAQTAQLIGRQATILGGIGGVYLLDELRQGSSGAITGFAYPEILVDIWRAWSTGDKKKAAEVYYQYLPALLFEGQPKLGLAVRKAALRRRGLIRHETIRAPGPQLDEFTAKGLDDTLEYLMLHDFGSQCLGSEAP